jgi:hypothetical protein
MKERITFDESLWLGHRSRFIADEPGWLAQPLPFIAQP